MKPGSIMNEAIAIKVMRWPLVQKKYEGDGLVWGFQSPHKHYLHYELPKFSEDISAAMRVVEAMKADIVEMVWHCDAEAWVVTFNDRHGPWSKSLPHAICLSALPPTPKVTSGDKDG